MEWERKSQIDGGHIGHAYHAISEATRGRDDRSPGGAARRGGAEEEDPENLPTFRPPPTSGSWGLFFSKRPMA